jgi:2-polyprenyl-3-methyl-5-hydroxy-6-metoxy-1,4-benzoquinol methylase
MICPHCKKPFYFLQEEKKIDQHAQCKKCGYSSRDFDIPSYENYHENLYENKKYTRTISTDPQMKYIFDKLDIKKTDAVLDIGCGIGDYTHAVYTKYSKDIVGVDHDIESAQKKYKDEHFMKYDCNKLMPFKNGQFDVIISVNVIEHLLNPKQFMEECSRILKKNGKIALVTANLNFFLHNYFFDKTHLYEWSMDDFRSFVEKYIKIDELKKSSAMFNYYPLNSILIYFIKPDIVCIGKKI